jgi:hypothetical protein
MSDSCDHGNEYVRFEVLTAVIMNVTIIWDIAPYSPYVNRRFGETYHFNFRSRKSAEQETSVQQVATQNLKMQLYVSPQRRFAYRPHGAISQKMATYGNEYSGYIKSRKSPLTILATVSFSSKTELCGCSCV